MKLQHPEKFNIALAEKVLDHVERFPEMHNQGVFLGSTHCGTAGCIAGWAYHLSCGALPGMQPQTGRARMAQHWLGLTPTEFAEFYTEMSEYAAKRIFADYIAQAKAAQDPPPALPVIPPTIPEPVGCDDKELVHA